MVRPKAKHSKNQGLVEASVVLPHGLSQALTMEDESKSRVRNGLFFFECLGQGKQVSSECLMNSSTIWQWEEFSISMPMGGISETSFSKFLALTGSLKLSLSYFVVLLLWGADPPDFWRAILQTIGLWSLSTLRGKARLSSTAREPGTQVMLGLEDI